MTDKSPDERPGEGLADALPVPPQPAQDESLPDALPGALDDDFFSPQDPGLSPLSCVGCGWCCLDNPCEVSHQAFGYAKRCPALIWTGTRYVCELVLRPVAGVDLTPLFVGQGCCARHNAWRGDVKDRG
jgi:hypothetical protein